MLRCEMYIYYYYYTPPPGLTRGNVQASSSLSRVEVSRRPPSVSPMSVLLRQRRPVYRRVWMCGGVVVLPRDQEA